MMLTGSPLKEDLQSTAPAITSPSGLKLVVVGQKKNRSA